MPAGVTPQVQDADSLVRSGGIQVGLEFSVSAVFLVRSIELESFDGNEYKPRISFVRIFEESIDKDCRCVDRFLFQFVDRCIAVMRYENVDVFAVI